MDGPNEITFSNIFDYLTTFAEADVLPLFDDVWACQAIFRSLPPLAKHYVMRLLWVDSSIDSVAIKAWVLDGGVKEHHGAVGRLVALCVFMEERAKGKSGKSVSRYSLQPKFQVNLRAALTDPDCLPWVSHDKPDKRRPSLQQLDKYSLDKWDSILHFLVSPTTARRPSTKMINLLLRTKLIEASNHEMKITAAGFQFLLQEASGQVWMLILTYVASSHLISLNKHDVLIFLFQLSFLSFGQEYPVDALSETHKVVLNDLREFGLIYRRKSSSSRFYPTRLAVELTGSSEGLATERGGFLVVETNFKIYAFTDSVMQINLMGLFVQLEYALPNLAVGSITRESVHKALASGIVANQIIRFLFKNAHPKAKARQEVVPDDVCKRILLWEQERHRARFGPGHLYDRFNSLDEFRRVETYARSIGKLLWSNASSRKMVVAPDGHSQVKSFCKKNL